MRSPQQRLSVGEEAAKLKPAEEVEMKGATVRGVIVIALALAMATLLMTGCPSPRGRTSGTAVHTAAMSRNTCFLSATGYWKNGLWAALPPLDSTKYPVRYSLPPPATQVVKCNVRCRCGEVSTFPQRAISHFIEKNKHCPLFLAFPLLTPSESHRAFMQKAKRKVMSSPHRAIAVSAFPALSLAGCPGGSPASSGTTLNSARWCRPPP